MKIAKLLMLVAVPLAGAASAQPAPPAAPKPCVMMPRQGSTPPPATGRPRDRCATAALPRAMR